MEEPQEYAFNQKSLEQDVGVLLTDLELLSSSAKANDLVVDQVVIHIQTDDSNNLRIMARDTGKSASISRVVNQKIEVKTCEHLHQFSKDLQHVQTVSAIMGCDMVNLVVKRSVDQNVSMYRLKVTPMDVNQFDDYSSVSMSKNSLPHTINVPFGKEADRESEITPDQPTANVDQHILSITSPADSIPDVRGNIGESRAEQPTTTLPTLPAVAERTGYRAKTTETTTATIRSSRRPLDLEDSHMSPHQGHLGISTLLDPLLPTLLDPFLRQTDPEETSDEESQRTGILQRVVHLRAKSSSVIIGGLLLLVAISLLTMLDSPNKKDQPRIGRRSRILACTRILSNGRGLSEQEMNQTAQWKAVHWFEGAGVNIEVPEPCDWSSPFGTLYSLIVTRETLGILDKSWYRTEPLADFSQICLWKRIACNSDQTSVKRLILNHAGLNGTIPLEISGLVDLSTVHMENNHLTGTIPTIFGAMTNLESLFLQETQLEGPIPTTLGQLTNLKQLLLDKTKVTGPMPSDICNLRRLHLESLHADCRDTLGPPSVECECPYCCTTCS